MRVILLTLILYRSNFNDEPRRGVECTAHKSCHKRTERTFTSGAPSSFRPRGAHRPTTAQRHRQFLRQSDSTRKALSPRYPPRVLSGTDVPSSKHFAIGFALWGVGGAHFHRRHSVYSPAVHRWVFPELRWDTLRPIDDTVISWHQPGRGQRVAARQVFVYPT